MKKYLLGILFIILLPIQLLADGPFLYSLPFNYYPDDITLKETQSKGIDYEKFEKYLLSNENELGKKVALLSALEVYFMLNDDKKSYFISYQDKFKNTIEKKYKTKISDTQIPVEIRFIHTLLTDYDTSSPKVDLYKHFVDETPESKTIQTVNVYAFNFDLIWNTEKRNYNDLKVFNEAYQYNYFINFDNLNNDAPENIYIELEKIASLGSDCGYNLTCLLPNSNDVNTLGELTSFRLNKIANAEPIPMMFVSENAANVGLEAYQWLGSEAQVIQDLKISDKDKALLNYFIANETYYFVNHVDNLFVYYDSLNKTKEVLSKSKPKKTTDSAFSKFKNIFEADNQNNDFGGSNLNDLRNLFYYLYQNPKELSKIFTN